MHATCLKGNNTDLNEAACVLLCPVQKMMSRSRWRARSKAWFCGRSLAGIAGPNPPRGHRCLSVVSVVCRQVEVSATSWGVTECGASLCVM